MMSLLMPDDFEDLQVVGWRVEPATPDANNPLVKGEMPWDRGGVMTHGTVLKDPIDGRFKAWIICTPADEELRDLPHLKVFTINHHYRRLCYFESADGINWVRPQLPNSRFGDHESSNIVFDDTANGGEEYIGFVQYASVTIDPEKPWPYEMFVYRDMSGPTKPDHSHLHHYRSRDGIQWELIYGPIKGPFESDVCFVYPAKFLTPDRPEGYISYYRMPDTDEKLDVPAYEIAGYARTIFRATSPDGKNWENIETVLKRDDLDHRDTQYMELIPHPVSGGYLGIVSVFEPINQMQHLRLAVSRNGVNWWFPARRPCLDNPPLGDYGGGMIWQSKNLVEIGDRLHIYYGGMEGIHRPIIDSRIPNLRSIGMDRVSNQIYGFLPFNSALCRASWVMGRFYALASASGGPTRGKAVTTSRPLGGKRLTVNLRTLPPKRCSTPGLDEGYLQVELLDAAGNPLPGFAGDDCQQMRGNQRAVQVEWTGGQIAPQGAAKARFHLKRAFLYGFEFT